MAGLRSWVGPANLLHRLQIASHPDVPALKRASLQPIRMNSLVMSAFTKIVMLDGSPLSFKQLAAVSDGKATVVASPAGLARCQEGRTALELAIANGVVVYGTTTGVGAMKDRAFGVNDLLQFNRGLVLAHHFAIGNPLPLYVVR